jgi:hypothetical protein
MSVACITDGREAKRAVQRPLGGIAPDEYQRCSEEIQHGDDQPTPSGLDQQIGAQERLEHRYGTCLHARAIASASLASSCPDAIC